MSITLGSNIASLQAQRQLFKTGGSLSSVFERLSSGQRINRASDDAAGLAISESLRTDRRVYNQAIRNLNDGLSVLNIADSTVAELSSVVIRIQELAEQAANGSLSNTQRASLDAEAQALSDEFFRVSRSADFNNLKLFDGSLADGVRLQGGYGTDGSIFSSLGGEMGDGTFQSATNYSAGNGSIAIELADFNGDGTLDLVTGNRIGDDLTVLLGNGDGTFQSATTLSGGNATNDVKVADLNSDGILDIIATSYLDNRISTFIGNGDGTFQDRQSVSVGAIRLPQAIDIGDINGDGNLDVVTANYFGHSASILLGNGDGTLTLSGALQAGATPTAVLIADINGDGAQDVLTGNSYGDDVTLYLGNGDGTFQNVQTINAGNFPGSLMVADLNNDGALDLVTGNYDDQNISVFLGNGDGSFQTAQSYAADGRPTDVAIEDLNGDGLLDIATTNGSSAEIAIFTGKGDGTFNVVSTFSVDSGPEDIEFGDLNGDGVLDAATANLSGDSVSILFGDTREGIAPILDFSLETQADALQAIAPLDRKLQSLSEQRGVIGAFQSRIHSAINTLGATSENYGSAESRIRDADIAFETSQLTRFNILQQAASSVLGQANQQPALALRLLGGG